MFVTLRLITGFTSAFCCLAVMLVAAENVFHVPAHDVGGFRHLLAPLLPMAVVVAVSDILVLGRVKAFRYSCAYLSLFFCLLLLAVANSWREGMNRDHHDAIRLLWNAFTFRNGGWWIALGIVAHVAMVAVIALHEHRPATNQGTVSD